jgi:lipopolysaccharide biosynthesis glycosyltransferase
MTTTPIHIVLTFDDRYWAPAYALMRSICLFTYRRKDLSFHLFTTSISPEHRSALEQIAAEFGATQTFYDIPQNPHFAAIAQRVRQSGQFPNVVYARILVTHILPAEIERVVYFDCDMLVRVPIERLYDMDMQDYPLAAVPDYVGVQIFTRRNLIDPRGIFDSAMRYFNSGMLLIDMNKWRAMNLAQQFERVIDDGTLARIYYDQDFLNLTFKDNWLELDWAWNLLDPRPLHEQLNPHVLHYTGKNKPWLYKPKVAFARLYRHAMTNDIYYRYMLERAPAWQRPIIGFVERMNRRTGAQGA